MTENKVQVYSTNREVEAEMIKQFLADKDIAAFLLNKMDYAYRFGEIEIYVSQDDAINARKLIDEYTDNE